MIIVRRMAAFGLIALTLLGTTLATASQAEAHTSFGAGLATGLIGGALVGGALAAPPARTVVYGAPISPVYAEPVYGQPVYAAPVYGASVYGAPVYGPPVHCHTAWHENHYGEVYKVRACGI